MSKRSRHIATYYDPEYAGRRMLEQDVPFFIGQLPKRRQDVLELAVGTGRAAIPVAQAGHRVVGVDYAPDMLALARRKRDSVGLGERELKLVERDVLDLDLRRKFDWICIFFNTFLAFTTTAEQDRLLRVVRRHLKPRGRFWLDIFNPDLSLLAQPVHEKLDAHAFFVPELDRPVFAHVSVRRAGVQLQRCTFHYAWFDEHGTEHREKFDFDLTYIFPRELSLLMERNGLRVEKLFGNYDGSEVSASSPRIIARCCRA